MDELNIAPLVLLLVGLVVTLVEEVLKFLALAGLQVSLSEAFKKWLGLGLSVVGAGVSLWLDGTIPALLLPVLPPSLEAWMVFITNCIGAVVAILMTATGLYVYILKGLSDSIREKVLEG